VGVRVGSALGDALGGVTVVTVSGGNWGVRDGLGDALRGAVVLGVVITVRGVGVGAPTVALVDALSPLLMMTAVAMAPRAATAPRTAVTGRQRRSAGQASSP
jgi:hypothetical protein